MSDIPKNARLPYVVACARCPYFLKPEPVRFTMDTVIGPGKYNYGRDRPERPPPHWCEIDSTLEFKWDHSGIHKKCPLPLAVPEKKFKDDVADAWMEAPE